MYTKQNLKHLFEAVNGFEEGVKEKSRPSCDDVSKAFFNASHKITQKIPRNRKEGKI
jgi:hypothetical protein